MDKSRNCFKARLPQAQGRVPVGAWQPCANAAGLPCTRCLQHLAGAGRLALRPSVRQQAAMCAQAFRPAGAKAQTTPAKTPLQAAQASSPGSADSTPLGRALEYQVPYHSAFMPPREGDP